MTTIDRYLSALAIIAVVVVPIDVVLLLIGLANRDELWVDRYLLAVAALTLAALIVTLALALALGHAASRAGH